MAKADLVIACDSIVGATKSTLAVMQHGRTYVALNTHGTPTAAFVKNPDWQFPGGHCEAVVRHSVGDALVGAFDAEQVAVQLVGDSIYTNPLMLGYAWQQGRVPLSHAALMRAIELNGVQVDNNKAAFEWGRHCAHDLASVQALFKAAQVIEFVRKPSLDEMIARRVDFLTGYQDAGYAAQYKAFVDKVRAAESSLALPTGEGRRDGGRSVRLTEAVARYLFKLMAYKDEYEVARLHTDAAFTAKIESMFEGDYKLVHHLAPPAIAKKNDQGELIKRPFGPWMRSAFSLLARLKGLRGSALDPFGRSDERRTERALIGEYRACIDELLAGLNATTLPLALEIARIPEEIRGYGHVKARHLQAARAKWQQLLGAVAQRQRRACGRLTRRACAGRPLQQRATRQSPACRGSSPGCGWVRSTAATCRRWHPTATPWSSTPTASAMHSALVHAPDRTAALVPINRALHEAGLIAAWRDETYAVVTRHGEPPLALIERAAARFWGTLTFGAHCNGYLADAGGRPTHLWIARRALTKATDPGLLDNLVGGGVPHGQTPFETLVREGFEEAGLDAPTMRRAVPGRVIELARDIRGRFHARAALHLRSAPAGRLDAGQPGRRGSRVAPVAGR